MKIKVEIKNLKTNAIGWGSQFNSQTSADSWVSDCISKNLWGKPQRTLRETIIGQEKIVYDVDGTIADISQATSQGTVEDASGNILKTYVLPCEYEVSYSDLTSEEEIETAKTSFEEAYKAKISEVFGTTDRIEMLETMQLWTLMLANPASFVDANKETFKNKVAVTTYATAKLSAILDFQTWKIKKINTLNTDIAAIKAKHS